MKVGGDEDKGNPKANERPNTKGKIIKYRDISEGTITHKEGTFFVNSKMSKVFFKCSSFIYC